MDVFLIASSVITAVSTFLGYLVGVGTGKKQAMDHSRRAINELNKSVDELVLSLVKPEEPEEVPTEPVVKGAAEVVTLKPKKKSKLKVTSDKGQKKKK